MFAPEYAGYFIGTWSIGGTSGSRARRSHQPRADSQSPSAPATGPLVSSFAAQVKGWKWPMLELVWIGGFAAATMFFLLPETLHSNILHRRAARLRRLTRNGLILKQAEFDAARTGASVWKNVASAIAETAKLSALPAALFANLYLGFVYGVSDGYRTQLNCHSLSIRICSASTHGKRCFVTSLGRDANGGRQV